MLSELVPAYIDRSAQREQFIQEMVRSVFREAVGERIAGQVTSISFRGRTLCLRVPDAAWRQELHMMRPQMAARLNEKAGERVVTDIRITG